MLRLATALCALLAVQPAAAKDRQVIRTATESAFPPYNFMKPDTTLAGYEIDCSVPLSANRLVDARVGFIRKGRLDMGSGSPACLLFGTGRIRGIGNQVHWPLDVVTNENQGCTRL